MPPVKLYILRLFLLMALLPCIANTAYAQIKIDSFRIVRDSGKLKPRFLLHSNWANHTIHSDLSLSAEFLISKIMLTHRFRPEHTHQWKEHPGFGFDVRYGRSCSRTNKGPFNMLRFEQGLGYTHYRGRVSESHVEIIDGLEVEIIEDYERYHMLKFQTAFGFIEPIRNTRMGAFLTLDNHVLLNYQENRRSSTLRHVMPYLGLELRWDPLDIKHVNGIYLGFKRTIRSINSRRTSRQNYMLGVGVNFNLYDF